MKDKIMKLLGYISSFLLGIIISSMFLLFNKPNESKFSFYSYDHISTSIDERGRLHLSFYEAEKTYILSDSVALGIHAQVSSEVYKDYLEKTKN